MCIRDRYIIIFLRVSSPGTKEISIIMEKGSVPDLWGFEEKIGRGRDNNIILFYRNPGAPVKQRRNTQDLFAESKNCIYRSPEVIAFEVYSVGFIIGVHMVRFKTNQFSIYINRVINCS